MKNWVKEKSPAPDTYNPRLSLMKSVFRHQKAKEAFVHNPLEALIGIKNDDKEVCVASPEEVKTLMDWVSENDSELIPYFAIGFFAGLEL